MSQASASAQRIFEILDTENEVQNKPGAIEMRQVQGDVDERLVFVRISSFGQDGPYSRRPGLDRVGIGYGGLLNLTGYPDRPPVRVGVTISDYLTEAGAMEAAYCGASCGMEDIDAWLALNIELGARKLARESRDASAAMGRRFLQLAAQVSRIRLLIAAADRSTEVHLPACFGLVARSMGLDVIG